LRVSVVEAIERRSRAFKFKVKEGTLLITKEGWAG